MTFPIVIIKLLRTKKIMHGSNEHSSERNDFVTVQTDFVCHFCGVKGRLL